MGRPVLEDVIGSVEIEIDDAVEHVFVGLRKVFSIAGLAGVMNDDVELAEDAFGLLEGSNDAFARGYVDMDVGSALVQQSLRRRLGIGNDHARFIAQATQGRAEADA